MQKGIPRSHTPETKDLERAHRKDIKAEKGMATRAKGAKEKERMASRETVFGAGSLATAKETVPTKTIT